MKSVGVWVFVLGLLMFGWGFCQLGYAFMDLHLPITIPFTEWGVFFGAEELFNDVQLFLAFGCMLAGVGMLAFKGWARILTVWLVWATGGFFFYIFMLVGPQEFEEFFVRKFVIVFMMALILLWFLNQEKTRETLNSDPIKKKKRLIPFTTMLFFVMAIFVFIVLPNELPRVFKKAYFPEIQQVNYPVKSREYYQLRYDRTEFPLPFTLALPKGTRLTSMNQAGGFVESRQCEFRMDTPGNGRTIFLKSETPVQVDWASPNTQKFLERILPLSPYEYARKIYSDRRSIMNWRSRNKIGAYGGDAIHEVNTGGMKSFIVKSENPGRLSGKPIHWYFDYNIFRKDKAAGGGLMFVFSGSERASMNILGSMQASGSDTKTSEEFFIEGNERARNGKYEKAKWSFASAVCVEMKNPSYHYGLGNMYFKTGNFEQADRHLTESLLLVQEGHEFPEAKALFEKTRKKLGKSIELEKPSAEEESKDKTE